MKYQLLPILDYPKSILISLEQAILYQTTQVVMRKRFARKSSTNGFAILHEQHHKVYRYIGYFIFKNTIPSVQQSPQEF